MPRDKKGAKGFTLIEIIAVLAVIAIVAAVVVTRATPTEGPKVIAAAEALKGQIRYAEMRAMNITPSSTAPTGCSASFGITATSLPPVLFKDCNTATTVYLPAENSTTSAALFSGMSLTVDNPKPTAMGTIITFDKFGSPCVDVLCNQPADANITLKLTHTASGVSRLITITKNTGFVP
jgi:prepilin-type N-terminal cleavage/methylation domain-containing protein